MRHAVKFNLARKEIYLEAIRKGCSKADAARAAGVSEQFAWEHRDKDAAFKAAVEKAELKACDLIEAHLYSKAHSDDPRWGWAAKYWLTHRSKDRWMDKTEVAPPSTDKAWDLLLHELLKMKMEQDNEAQGSDPESAAGTED